MYTLYSYEELNEDIREKIKKDEITTNSYKVYKNRMADDYLEELLEGEFTDFTVFDDHIAVNIKKEKGFIYLKGVEESSLLDKAFSWCCFDLLGKIPITFELEVNSKTNYALLGEITNKLTTIIKIRIERINEAYKEFEPDFDAYMTDRLFLEDGTEMVVATK